MAYFRFAAQMVYEDSETLIVELVDDDGDARMVRLPVQAAAGLVAGSKLYTADGAEYRATADLVAHMLDADESSDANESSDDG